MSSAVWYKDQIKCFPTESIQTNPSKCVATKATEYICLFNHPHRCLSGYIDLSHRLWRANTVRSPVQISRIAFSRFREHEKILGRIPHQPVWPSFPHWVGTGQMTASARPRLSAFPPGWMHQRLVGQCDPPVLNCCYLDRFGVRCCEYSEPVSYSRRRQRQQQRSGGPHVLLPPPDLSFRMLQL